MRKKRKSFWIYFLLIIGAFMFFNVSCSDDEAEPSDDENGYEYKTVVIGNLEWMAENLRNTTYADGSEIPNLLSYSEWSNASTGAYSIYPHDEVNGINSEDEMINAYGLLYNWYAVVDGRGLCPIGWRVPSIYELEEMLDYLEDNYGIENTSNSLKAARQLGHPWGGIYDTQDHPRWNLDDTHYGTDDFGFTALPGGNRNNNGEFWGIGIRGNWWTKTEHSESYARLFSIVSYEGYVFWYEEIQKERGLSVRCVKSVE